MPGCNENQENEAQATGINLRKERKINTCKHENL